MFINVILMLIIIGGSIYAGWLIGSSIETRRIWRTLDEFRGRNPDHKDVADVIENDYNMNRYHV